MDERKADIRKHEIVLRGREILSASGIEDVESFDDDKIVAYTVEGQMTIKGAQLRINKLSVDDGELEIQGIIDSLEYQDVHHGDGSGFWSKIFK